MADNTAERAQRGSLPFPLGLSRVGQDYNFALYSESADAVDVVSFGDDGRESAQRLTDHTGHVFHGRLEGLGPGTRYGLRVHGPWDPANGLRYNAAKLLMDPYATAIEGEWDWGEAVFGHHHDDPERLNDADSAPSSPRCVVTADDFDWGSDTPPRRPLGDTVIYETHVMGFTRKHPDVPSEIRGTYAGMAHPAALDYLTDLGVTAVELLPVHHFAQDSHLLEKGLRNYWGYNSIGFFAPHGDYAAAGSGGGQVDEFKAMVKAMHAAGLEVILDVVYNHTAEGNDLGPTLSLKGIDNPSYYRLVDEDRAHYFDTTGTGNSVNVSHPAGLQLIMDSLRYWVTQMHVDGFRFDLATTLTRQDGRAEVHSAFLDLVHQDPVLAPVKLIAEPWDTAGYQVGGFPARWSEWNGKFRDDVRDFWRSTDGALGGLAMRVSGSPDVYQADRRSPLCSVNFITAHDGFTLADLTSYDDKHNEANGEDNSDGESDNRSWGGGAEGPTDDGDIVALRRRQQRNLLTTLLLSAGVPMLLGGDEFGRTQGGNNNAYCQDNEISWFDWELARSDSGQDLHHYAQKLLRLRREYPSLRPTEFGGEDPAGISFIRADGAPMGDEDWSDPANKAVTLRFSGASTDILLLANAADDVVEFTLPDASTLSWDVAATSDPEQAVDAGSETVLIRDHSITVLVAANGPAAGTGE
jgi:isoamylase